MTLKNVFVFSLLLLGWLVSAQTTDSETELTDPSGNIELFQLRPDVSVCALPRGNGFYTVHFVAFVQRIDFVDGILAEGSLLFNEDLDTIGKTLVEIEEVPDSIWDMRRFRGYHQVELTGRLHKTRFHSSSIPEIEYGDILKTKSRTAQEERLEALFEGLSFEEREEEDFTFMIKRQTGRALKYYGDREPFRMIIVLRGARPFCVITSANIPFEAPKIKDQKEESPYRFYYFQKARPEIHERIRDVMYDYVSF